MVGKSSKAATGARQNAMTNQQDLFAQVSAAASKARNDEGALRASLKSLSEQLIAACGGIRVHARGETITFDECVYGYQYGRWSFDRDGLSIAYRSNTDDEDDALSRNPYPDIYHTYDLETCPFDWLRMLTTADQLRSIVRAVCERLTEVSLEARDGVQTVAHLSDTPTLSIAFSLEQVSTDLGYDGLVQDWKRAQEAVYTDAASALTRASNLVETVCKHILDDKGEELPKDMSIMPLFRSTCSVLSLDASQQLENGMRGLGGGLTSVVQNIGLLRTQVGDAHGRGRARLVVSRRHARLAVNAAGLIATYLMNCWTDMKAKG